MDDSFILHNNNRINSQVLTMCHRKNNSYAMMQDFFPAQNFRHWATVYTFPTTRLELAVAPSLATM